MFKDVNMNKYNKYIKATIWVKRHIFPIKEKAADVRITEGLIIFEHITNRTVYRKSQIKSMKLEVSNE